MKKIRIPDLKPREYQLPFFQAMDKGHKRAVLVWHRRAGKEITCWNYMIREAVCSRVGTYCYFFPTSRLGRRILWDGANKDGKRFIDYIPPQLIQGSPNAMEMKIELKNGSVIQIMGTENILNVGINPIGCVFSEFSLQDPKTWDFVRPILRENEGWAVFNFTPRGKNHAFDLYQMAKDNDDWFCQKLSIEDTGVLSAADMAIERNEGMSENLIQQEYYCNFDQGIEGSFYAKYLNEAEKQERVTNVPYDPYTKVDTYWDLGVSDSTCIIFAQNVGQEIHIIDCYTNEGEGLDHYARVVENKAKAGLWQYGVHCAPHDIKVRELGHGAKTRLQMAREMGLHFEIVPNLSIHEGIEMARAMWHKLWIDKKNCGFFIKCAENYHRVYNEKHNVFSDKPRHDWSSHCFIGSTKIWTRNGIQRIMDLPPMGEVLTLNGWSSYECPRITRKDAELVEVNFQDGMTVRCTPDHLFLTENGWKSAENLTKNIKIQSSLMPGCNTGNQDYTSYGQTKSMYQKAVNAFTELFGKWPSETYLTSAISTTKMEIHKIIDWITWSACQPKNTYQLVMLAGRGADSRRKVNLKLENGINQMKDGCGTETMQNELRHGQNGRENLGTVSSAGSSSTALFEKAGTLKSTVIQTVKPCIIENVKKLKNKEDVWCLSVPNEEHFSLENGAIVHNCMDAFRYMGVMQNKTRRSHMTEHEANDMEKLYVNRY